MDKTTRQRYIDNEGIFGLALYNSEVTSGKRQGQLKFKYVFVDLARRCNLNCRGCFESLDRNRSYEKLDFSEIKDTVDFAYDREVRTVIIAGAGEPTLDEDFSKVVRYIHKKEMSTLLFTNGTTLDEKLSNFLFDNNVSPIVKKFAMDHEKHDYLIGKKGMSEKMQGGLDTLRRVKGQREAVGKLTSDIALYCYISRENTNDIKDVLRYCRDNSLTPHMEAFITSNQCAESIKLAPSQEELNEMFDALAKIDKDEYGIETELKSGARVYGGDLCMKNKVIFSVRTNGDIYECVSGHNKFGNIRENTLEEIFDLSNPKVKEFYSDINCHLCDCSLGYKSESGTSDSEE